MARRIAPWHDLASLWHLVRLLRRLRPRIVHSHTPKGGLLGMIGAYCAGIPVRVYTIHGLPMVTATGMKRRLLRLSEVVACRLAHRVLCVSASNRALAVAEGLCPEEKITVLGQGSICGVDAQKFCPVPVDAPVRLATRQAYGIPAAARVIGFVGRIVRDKGIQELAAAWLTLRDAFPDAHLLLVGPFEPQDPISDTARATLEGDPRIHLVGQTFDTPPLYAAMDVVTLPTYREGFPIVPLECAAMGLPMVATTVPGCVDAVVDGETGTLVPPRDAAALAQALARYLREAALRQQHGEAARTRVIQSFQPEYIADCHYQEYHRLLSARGAID
jgi:glycosyltransferase involved in cell wall biosynthesis